MVIYGSRPGGWSGPGYQSGKRSMGLVDGNRLFKLEQRERGRGSLTESWRKSDMKVNFK